ncbi:MAG: hypothetical protein KatS3mg129_2079 [Leptospiraceae bacterium]|nr:MAG: hypothetical protein KatS3mg129_2079 [Leptospiraceae bacterium]
MRILTKREIQKLYEEDFYLWIKTQIELLKEKRWELIDIENLIEELESMGRSEIRSLASYIGILFAHLYKWDQFPEKRTRSWMNSILYSRKDILKLLKKQPSLKSKLNEAIEDGWDEAKKIIVKDTDIDYRTLPDNSPYTFEDAMNRKIEL